MIRNIFAAVLTLVMLAGSVRGDTIRADLIQAHGSSVSITVQRDPSNNEWTTLPTKAGPYRYLLSYPNGDEAKKVMGATFAVNGKSGYLLTFCFDLYDFTDPEGNQTGLDPQYTIGSLQQAFSGSSTITIDSQKEAVVKRLWNLALLNGFKPSVLPVGPTPTGDALSIAIWEALYDNGSSTTPFADGRFRVTSNGSWSAVKTTAASWLAQAISATDTPAFALRALMNPDKQDQCLIYFDDSPKPVPEPALAIQLLGLCVAGVLPLRYWRRGRKGAA